MFLHDDVILAVTMTYNTIPHKTPSDWKGSAELYHSWSGRWWPRHEMADASIYLHIGTLYIVITNVEMLPFKTNKTSFSLTV